MSHVMEMSTDQDIRNTQLDRRWLPVTRYNWQQVSTMNLQLPDRAVIVVIAHGNGSEIGNRLPGGVDIPSDMFLAMIQANMAANAHPASIYISACGVKGMAEFAANVRRAANQNQIWANTRIFGHGDAIAGPVPPPNDIRWFEIFGPGRRV